MSFKELLAIQRRIFSFLLPYWKVAASAIFFTVIVAFVRLFPAKLIGWLIELISPPTQAAKPVPEPPTADPVGLKAYLPDINFDFTLVDHDQPMQSLQTIILCYFVMIVVGGVSSFSQKYLTAKASQSAVRDLRSTAFAKLQNLSMQFFESMRLGEIQSRCTSDVIAATSIYTNLADFLKNSLIVVLALMYMVYADWQLTLLIFLLAPVLGIAVGKFGRKIGQETEKLQSRVADLSAIIIENTASQKVVKAYHRESHEIERYDRVNQENYNTQMKLVKVGAIQTPVIELLSVIGIASVVYFGASKILGGTTTLHDSIIYWGVLGFIIQPITSVSSFYSTFQASSAAGRRVFEIMDRVPKVQEAEDAHDLPPIKGHIEFKDVRFSYDEEKEILRGVDFEAQAGEVVAIVGTNGAGKTTFVNLVPRFYDPSSGSVMIDGHDLRELTISSLRTQVGTVIQESVLFAGSIADNIACGSADYSKEEIIEAAKIANADEFIVRMPKGYDTEIGERGVKLSGGQRQRIAIARALLRDPKILILDEFTSGIDTESENLITEAIERIMRGRTSLVIAHRLNTIRHADRIIVLDAGQIVEEGNHEKLLENNGLYTKLYEAQLRTPVGLLENKRKGA